MDAGGTNPSVTWHDEMERELSRIEESALYSGQSQFAQTKIWRTVNIGLGVPGATLAALSGGIGLANPGGRSTAAILALIAAGLTAVVTTLNPTHKAERAHHSGNAYLDLQNRTRVFRTIDLRRLDYSEARQGFQLLEDRRTDINREAEVPFALAYWMAKRNIRRGGTTYEVDK